MREIYNYGIMRCIAECYLVEESIRFCISYMKEAGSIGNRTPRNEDLEMKVY